MATYDAFLSYSHAEDRGVARRLREGVEKFAKPWYRVRASRVFLDNASLSADPSLWSSVERALSSSAWFVLVASPRAAGSPWVEREIRWWLENRSADLLLIVVAEGDLRWDPEAGDFDATASTALPPVLLGALREEPRWVTVPPVTEEHPELTDLEFRDTVVDVATAIRGMPKEELVGAAASEHRRTMRWVRGTIAVLSILLLAAVVAGVIALHQRSTAIAQARVALSRQIASVSREAAGSNLRISMLLAVEAYKRDPNPETRAALFAANTTSPHLERFLDAGGRVERLVGSARGAVVAGLADGRVMLWAHGEDDPRQLFHLRRPVSSLVISHDGSVVAATDETEGLLWRQGAGISHLPTPPGQDVDTVGLSPSGKTIAYHASRAEGRGGESVTIAPTSDSSMGMVHPMYSSVMQYGGKLVLPSDSRLLMLGYGSWQWKRLSDWATLMSSEGFFGAHQYGMAVSADGGFFTVTNSAEVVPVWSTSMPAPDLGESDLGVEAPITSQTALALSPDGGKIAVAGNEGIYVAPVLSGRDRRVEAFESVESLNPAAEPVELTGQTGVGEEALAFAGDDRHLLSAAGSEIALWNLDRVDRLARVTTVPLIPSCFACEGANLAISPDGKRIAVTDEYGSSGFVQSLQGDPNRETLPEGGPYMAPVWQANGGFAAFPIQSTESASCTPPDLPEEFRVWCGASDERAEAEAIAEDGKTVMVVGDRGNVHWYDAATGALEQSVSLSAELEDAALDSSPEMLATVRRGKVVVEKLPSGEVTGEFEVGELASVAFSGDRLLVQRNDGPLEVWDEQGRVLERTIAGGENLGGEPPVGNADGSMVARRRSDGSVVLTDLHTGAQLATFDTREPSTFLKTGVAFSPQGDSLYLLTEKLGSENEGDLVSRGISDSALAATACEAAGRNLTPAEWRAYIGSEPPSDLSCR